MNAIATITHHFMALKVKKGYVHHLSITPFEEILVILQRILATVENQIDLLIVDDQIKTRQALKALLQFSPFIRIIWEAQNGETALKIVSDERPDLVIMDVQMPVMNGLEATQWIKENLPETKVIILTMYPHYEEEALSAGADCFLVKGDRTYSIQDVIQSFVPNENSNCNQ